MCYLPLQVILRSQLQQSKDMCSNLREEQSKTKIETMQIQGIKVSSTTAIIYVLSCNKQTFKDDRNSFTRVVFFKRWEFYEISCDVSLKPFMQINEIKKKYWAFSQYIKICDGRDHCFMCDIIRSRNTQIHVFSPNHLFEKPHISLTNKKKAANI